MITLNFKEIYWIAATATIANIIYHEESKIKLKKNINSLLLTTTKTESKQIKKCLFLCLTKCLTCQTSNKPSPL